MLTDNPNNPKTNHSTKIFFFYALFFLTFQNHSSFGSGIKCEELFQQKF